MRQAALCPSLNEARCNLSGLLLTHVNMFVIAAAGNVLVSKLIYSTCSLKSRVFLYVLGCERAHNNRCMCVCVCVCVVL